MRLTERGEHVIGSLTARGRRVVGSLTDTGRLVFPGVPIPPIPPVPPPPFMGGPSRETQGQPWPHIPARVSEWGHVRIAVSVARSEARSRQRNQARAHIRLHGTGQAQARMEESARRGLTVRTVGRDRLIAGDSADELWLLGLDDLGEGEHQ